MYGGMVEYNSIGKGPLKTVSELRHGGLQDFLFDTGHCRGGSTSLLAVSSLLKSF
jgi:hypothetical protein